MRQIHTEIDCQRVRIAPSSQICVPDAGCALFIDDKASGNPVRIDQRIRRSRILAGARRLLSENGFDLLSIQRLAADLDLSKQTIYNLIGTKRDVASTAIIDQLAWMAATVRLAPEGSNKILGMVDLYCDNVRRNPNYFRHAALAMFQRDRSLCMEVRSMQQAWFNLWLRGHALEGRLRPDVDLGLLARQLVVLNEANMLDLANGLCDEDELICNLVASHGMMLRGAATHAETEVIDRWMHSRLTMPTKADYRAA